MTSKITKRLAAGVAALALGLTGAVAFVAPASATTGPNIDPKATGTITIHKHAQPDVNGTPATGIELPAAPANPLADVFFTVTPVTNVDLTTNAGWDQANALAAALSSTGALPSSLGTPIALPKTNAQGIAASDQLPLGLYLVREVAPLPGNIVAPAAPFLVSVPLPVVAATPPATGTVPGWNYNVHVYPKNSVADKPVKAVDDSKAFVLGDIVNWTITSRVPAFSAAEELTSYTISDTLDARLQYVAPATVSLNGTDLVLATDYTLSADDANPVVVTFTAAGLAKLFAAPNGTVIVKIATEVVSIGDGTITNTAVVNVNGSAFDTNEVHTKWGALKIVKHAEDAPQTTLAGAVFDVYAVDPASPGAVPVLTGLTTNANGEILVEGLKAGTFWVVETKAPAGYLALTAPIEVAVAAGSITDAHVERVANTPVPVWELPLTGGDGALWFGLGGGALVLVAAGAALVIARRSKANA